MTKCTTHTLRYTALAAAATLTLGVGLATPASAAAAPSASVANHTLTIRGTGGGDTITLAADLTTPGVLTVDFGNGTVPQSFDESTFGKISAFLDGGDDTFTAPPDFDFSIPVTVSGGAGNDRIDGGRGNDTEILGGDDDTAVWFPGNGNDTIDGGAGADTLDFEGSNAGETLALSANGGQVVLTRDIGAVRTDADRVETVHVATLGGADSLTIGDLSGTDVATADVDLAAFDGGDDAAADSVTVTGTSRADHVDVSTADSAVSVAGLHTTTRISGAEGGDHLQVDTLGGNDSVALSPTAGDVLDVGVDLGTGQR